MQMQVLGLPQKVETTLAWLDEHSQGEPADVALLHR
jgi:hypothetical protein